MDKELVKISKYISMILRHKPEEVGIELDENGGWVNVSDLIDALDYKGVQLTAETLDEIVYHNTKDRLSFNEDHSRVRANYGHSIPVLIDLEPVIPPVVLYHGTALKYLESIKRQGIVSKTRQYVHLADELETAKLVAIRHGKPVILNVYALKMNENGFKFYKAANGIWLTDHVPLEYFKDRNEK